MKTWLGYVAAHAWWEATAHDSRLPCCVTRVSPRYPEPFDRHDWIVDRCGTEVRYVIDYYYNEAVADQDETPALHDTDRIKVGRDSAVRVAAWSDPRLTTIPRVVCAAPVD